MGFESWETTGFSRDSAAALLRGGLSPLVCVTLASRGITEPGEIDALLTGGAACLADPLTMRDMAPAAARIRRAVESGEHVAVYGDYDVDGITSTCLMADWLRGRGLRCEIYIPERLTEGYGVKREGIDKLARLGVTLTVTVDCGITAVEEAAYAASLGMELVITDHHECAPALPQAAAVVDPKRRDCPYPGKTLAGVGVAFQLLRALEGSARTEALLAGYGDYVAVGTLADVMPVTGENRELIRRGLEKARRGDRPGLRQLCLAAGVEPAKLSAASVSFALAPRLNAAGRLGRTEDAVELLLTGDDRRAEALAAEMCALNRERQRLEGEMLEAAFAMLRADPPADAPIVLADAGWHQGVAGIVASRLSEKYNLPVVMICLQEERGRGSCRSVRGFNLYAALAECRALLEGFGGHEMAAGLTIRKAQIPALRQQLGALYRASGAAARRHVLHVDAELTKPRILTVENVAALEQLEPYGNGNPLPVFSILDARVRSVQPIGSGRHTRLWLWKDGEALECVFFARSPEELGVSPGQSADIAFIPQVNDYRGRRSVQLLLADIRVCEGGEHGLGREAV